MWQASPRSCLVLSGAMDMHVVSRGVARHAEGGHGCISHVPIWMVHVSAIYRHTRGRPMQHPRSTAGVSPRCCHQLTGTVLQSPLLLLVTFGSVLPLPSIRTALLRKVHHPGSGVAPCSVHVMHMVGPGPALLQLPHPAVDMLPWCLLGPSFPIVIIASVEETHCKEARVRVPVLLLYALLSVRLHQQHFFI